MNQFIKSSLSTISFYSCLFKVIPALVGLITARLLSEIIDKAYVGNTKMVIEQGLLLLGLVAATKIFKYFVEVWYRKKESLAIHNCKMELYQRFLNTPLSGLYTSEFGDVKEKLTDDFQIVTGRYTSIYPDIVAGIISIIVYFSFLAEQEIVVAVILLVMSFVLLLPPIIINQFLQVNYERCREIESKLYDFIVSGYRGFLTIKLYGLKQWWLDKLKGYHKIYAKIGSKSIYAATAESALMEFAATITKYGTYALLGVMILINKVERSVAIEAIALSGAFFAAIQEVFSAIPRYGVAQVAQRRLNQWDLSGDAWKEEEERLVSGRCKTDYGKSGILLYDVAYGINGKQIFNHLHLNLDEGKCYLIKGENGIGKSTLFRLLIGLIPCESGQISIGGYDPMELSENLYQQIFYLAQEDVEFDLTPLEVYEMVDFHMKDVISQNVVDFGLTEEQLQTVKISELSGGERKKVYLALAFARNPHVLLLDEPTNSLDALGKEILISKILKRSGSTLIISHDPIFDSVADEVLHVEERGIAVEKNRTKKRYD